MSIVIPPEAAGVEVSAQTDLFRRLAEAGADVLTPEDAVHQDIRPARVGLINLMPKATLEDTEVQWYSLLGNVGVQQIEPVLVQLPDDPRIEKGGSRANALRERYVPFEQVQEQGLDGLIITGANVELRPESTPDNPELLPFEEVTFFSQLQVVLDWADSDVYLTIASCWAGHAALYHRHGLERQAPDQKVFGVYEHDITTARSQFTRQLGDTIRAPHSRWGTVLSEEIEKANVTILADNPDIGCALAEDRNKAGHTTLYVPAHIEYGRVVLHHEYQRDIAEALAEGFNPPAEPADYYHPATREPRYTWPTFARAVMDNCLTAMYHRTS